MSRVTPENKVKRDVRKVLDSFCENVELDGFSVPSLKQYWPVPSGFGASDLDCIVCYYGCYIAIETKAPGKKPTPRQQLTIAETRAAGGHVMVIDGDEGCEQLRALLQGIKNARADNR